MTEPFLTAATVIFPRPLQGRLELRDGHAPRVRFAGTSWRIKICGSRSALQDGQLVSIVGRRGICLLIRL